jgi:hypothetical protein
MSIEVQSTGNVPSVHEASEEPKKEESIGRDVRSMGSDGGGTQSKFASNSNPSVYAKMLMTGMGSLGVDGAQTHMMQAKNNLKMMAH